MDRPTGSRKLLEIAHIARLFNDAADREIQHDARLLRQIEAESTHGEANEINALTEEQAALMFSGSGSVLQDLARCEIRMAEIYATVLLRLLDETRVAGFVPDPGRSEEQANTFTQLGAPMMARLCRSAGTSP